MLEKKIPSDFFLKNIFFFSQCCGMLGKEVALAVSVNIFLKRKEQIIFTANLKNSSVPRSDLLLSR